MSGTIALGVHPSLTERMVELAEIWTAAHPAPSTRLFPSGVGTPEQDLALGVFFWRSTRRLSWVVGSSRSLVLNLLQGRIEA